MSNSYTNSKEIKYINIEDNNVRAVNENTSDKELCQKENIIQKDVNKEKEKQNVSEKKNENLEVETVLMAKVEETVGKNMEEVKKITEEPGEKMKDIFEEKVETIINVESTTKVAEKGEEKKQETRKDISKRKSEEKISGEKEYNIEEVVGKEIEKNVEEEVEEVMRKEIEKEKEKEKAEAEVEAKTEHAVKETIKEKIKETVKEKLEERVKEKVTIKPDKHIEDILGAKVEEKTNELSEKKMKSSKVQTEDDKKKSDIVIDEQNKKIKEEEKKETKEEEKKETKEEEEETKEEEDRIKAHIETLRKLKSNQEIDLKRGDEIRKNICVFVHDDLILKKKSEVLNESIKRLALNTFHLYFPKDANIYGELPTVLSLLKGEVDNILIGLKYLIEHICKINFIVVSTLEKLKGKKEIKNNEVIIYIINFILKKLYENNLNYRYKKDSIIDFYDNVMHWGRTFFESGVGTDAINVQDLRVIYFYKHNIKIKKERKFLNITNNNNYIYKNSETETQKKKEENTLIDFTMDPRIDKKYIMKRDEYESNYKYFAKKKKKIDGEVPIPNKYIGIYESFEEESIFDHSHFQSQLFSNKKKIINNLKKYIKKSLRNKKKCILDESDVCKCTTTIIVNVNGDAHLREKINIARKEIKNSKSFLAKIRKIEILVEKFIANDDENIIIAPDEDDETNRKKQKQEEINSSEDETEEESETSESDSTNNNMNNGTNAYSSVNGKRLRTEKTGEERNCSKISNNKNKEIFQHEGKREQRENESIYICHKRKSEEMVGTDLIEELNNPNYGRECKHLKCFETNEKELNTNYKKTFSELYDEAEREEYEKELQCENNSNSSKEEKSETIKTFFFEDLDFNCVLLGSIKKGSDRHKALLFKVLCDAVDVPCRFVRYIENKKVKYFNLVLVPSIPSDNVIESIIPILWGKKHIKENMIMMSKLTVGNFLNNLQMEFNQIDRFFLKIWKNNKESINLDDYFFFKKKLGVGGFGEVWNVEFKEEPKSVDSFFYINIKNTSNFALKIMDFNEFNLNESVIMREKAHPNILKIYCVFKGYQMLTTRNHKEEKKESICFLIQLADTSLEKIFSDSNVAYNLNFIRFILLEVANVMSHLHKANYKREFYIYRDLKPDNILLKSNNVLLTDFNLSRKMDENFEYFMSQCCGTKGHLAPEQKSVAYDKCVDVWAFSIIIGKFLKHKNFNFFSHSNYIINLKHFGIQDKFLINLLYSCIDENPFMRPTFDDITKMLFNEIVRNELEYYTRKKMIKELNEIL